MYTVAFGDKNLIISIPDELDHGFNEKGNLLVFKENIEYLNLWIGTVSAITSGENAGLNAIIDNMSKSAKAKGVQLHLENKQLPWYSHESNGEYERIPLKVTQWLVGFWYAPTAYTIIMTLSIYAKDISQPFSIRMQEEWIMPMIKSININPETINA